VRTHSGKLSARMITHKPVSTPAVAAAQPVNHSPQPWLKIALDVHLAWHVIAAQEDGGSPKPPQRFQPADFLKWVGQKVSAGYRVVTCYEAGPFGYTLHRQLTALGVTNYVIRPRNWDEQHKRVKTDRTDALAMLNALDRFCAGNKKALALVHVPTEVQERQRSQTRLRQSLVRDLKMIAARGRGLALQYGFRLKGDWFGRRNWPRWENQLPEWFRTLIQPLRQSALFVHDQIKQVTDQIEAASVRPRPKGMGGLTEQLLDREVGDWTRFKNRRQVSSYLGLCPSENSSGQRHQLGSVTKCGNPRLRWALAEMAWRLLRCQPEYRLTKKWKPRLLDPHATPGRRKQALVALARGFGVDWWRLCTGQTTPEKPGLVMGN
jgi:transposase